MRKFILMLAIIFAVPFAVSFNKPAAADTTYEQAMFMDKPAALEFYSDWCSACKQAMPVINSVKPDYASKINFVSLNISKPENANLSNKYQIRTIPAIVLVNPKTGETRMINYRICQNPELLRNELDNYLKSYHQ